MVRINGKDVDAVGIKLSDYLEASGYKPDTIAVEINEEIVPKSIYTDTILNDGDVVEVVNFVGGGCSDSLKR